MKSARLSLSFGICLISGILSFSSAFAAVDTATPLDGATIPDTGEQRQTPVEGPRIGAVGESSGVFHMGASGCNAWVVDGNHIVTNNHCVDRGGVKLVFYRQGGKIEITNCKPQPVARSAKLDYAVFNCPEIGAKVPPVRIADRELKTGEDITLVTHDLQNPGKQRHAKGKMGAPVSLPNGGTGYETIGATVISGNSGSVLYDKNGNAVGLIWGADETNPKTGVMSSLREVVADIKKHTNQVAFNLTGEPNRVVADTPNNGKSEDRVPRTASEEPPARVAETPVRDTPVAAVNNPTPVDTTVPAVAPANVTPTSARTDTGSSFKDNLPTIALVGAGIAAAFLVYKIIQDRNETDRKYAELQYQQQLAANTATTTVTTTGTGTTLTTQPSTAVTQAYQGPVSQVLKRDLAGTTNGVKRVPMMVKRLGAHRMPYLRTDYVQQRPAAAQAPSRRLKQESL
ncbi:MAG: trypsin-like peptidase domain-containing protein [Bdellovibrionaceae bacterium]|nr:trypsin-like peptidase domain-containing protein [Pseudobdellovibrionaceae bacterium]